MSEPKPDDAPEAINVEQPKPDEQQADPPAVMPELTDPGMYDIEIELKGHIASLWFRFGVERRGKIERANLLIQVAQKMTPAEFADALRRSADIAETKINAETLDAMDRAKEERSKQEEAPKPA